MPTSRPTTTRTRARTSSRRRARGAPSSARQRRGRKSSTTRSRTAPTSQRSQRSTPRTRPRRPTVASSRRSRAARFSPSTTSSSRRRQASSPVRSRRSSAGTSSGPLAQSSPGRRSRSTRSRTRSRRRFCKRSRTQPFRRGSRLCPRSTRIRSRTLRAMRPQPPRPTPAPLPPPASRVPDRGEPVGALVDLQELAERLRRDCPWDRAQTAQTIVPHTVEEAYEVADAALAEDDTKLVEELGDPPKTGAGPGPPPFQTFFPSPLLEERGAGDLAAVARTIHEKLVRRHPHV